MWWTPSRSPFMAGQYFCSSFSEYCWWRSTLSLQRIVLATESYPFQGHSLPRTGHIWSTYDYKAPVILALFGQLRCPLKLQISLHTHLRLSLNPCPRLTASSVQFCVLPSIPPMLIPSVLPNEHPACSFVSDLLPGISRLRHQNMRWMYTHRTLKLLLASPSYRSRAVILDSCYNIHGIYRILSCHQVDQIINFCGSAEPFFIIICMESIWKRTREN